MSLQLQTCETPRGLLCVLLLPRVAWTRASLDHKKNEKLFSRNGCRLKCRFSERFRIMCCCALVHHQIGRQKWVTVQAATQQPPLVSARALELAASKGIQIAIFLSGHKPAANWEKRCAGCSDLGVSWLELCCDADQYHGWQYPRVHSRTWAHCNSSFCACTSNCKDLTFIAEHKKEEQHLEGPVLELLLLCCVVLSGPLHCTPFAKHGTRRGLCFCFCCGFCSQSRMVVSMVGGKCCEVKHSTFLTGSCAYASKAMAFCKKPCTT